MKGSVAAAEQAIPEEESSLSCCWSSTVAADE